MIRTNPTSSRRLSFPRREYDDKSSAWGTALLAIVLTAWFAAPSFAAEKPNFVFILVDDKHLLLDVSAEKHRKSSVFCRIEANRRIAGNSIGLARIQAD